jgi:hypothetical protein
MLACLRDEIKQADRPFTETRRIRSQRGRALPALQKLE